MEVLLWRAAVSQMPPGLWHPPAWLCAQGRAQATSKVNDEKRK